jgi:hypothetical protein
MSEESKGLSLSFVIKSIFTFRYISNLAIFVSLIAYYTNAYDIFFHFVPLLIVNFIMIMFMIFYNLDELMNMDNLKNRFPEKKDRDELKPLVVLFIILWHVIPLLWLIYILQSQDIIKIFHPNFMGIFLKSSLIPISYAYFESKLQVYGDINYLAYYIVYFILLFATCVYLYH